MTIFKSIFLLVFGIGAYFVIATILKTPVDTTSFLFFMGGYSISSYCWERFVFSKQKKG